MKIVAVFDNGVSVDRYTIVFDQPWSTWVDTDELMCLSLSSDPDGPAGFSQWGGIAAGSQPGIPVAFGALPRNVQAHVLDRAQIVLDRAQMTVDRKAKLAARKLRLQRRRRR